MALIEIDALPFLTAWWIFPWQTVNVITIPGRYVRRNCWINRSTTIGWPQSCLVTSSRGNEILRAIEKLIQPVPPFQWFRRPSGVIIKRGLWLQNPPDKVKPVWPYCRAAVLLVKNLQLHWLGRIFLAASGDTITKNMKKNIQIDQQGLKKIEIYLPHMGDFTKLMFWHKVWKTERQAMAFRQDDLPRSRYLVRCVTARSSILDVQRFL